MVELIKQFECGEPWTLPRHGQNIVHATWWQNTELLNWPNSIKSPRDGVVHLLGDDDDHLTQSNQILDIILSVRITNIRRREVRGYRHNSFYRVHCCYMVAAAGTISRDSIHHQTIAISIIKSVWVCILWCGVATSYHLFIIKFRKLREYRHQ